MFQKNVFINCPFDDQYRFLLQPLLFTILYLDLNPLISETESAADIRINKIIRHIRNSKYSVHDISRSEALLPGDLPRFNMPYEMGLDIGCQSFGEGRLKRKKCLILDRERYRFHKVLSDIGGQDPKDHNNDPETLIRKVREWFAPVLKTSLSSPTVIWESYNEFWVQKYEELQRGKFTQNEIDHLPFSEFISYAKRWIKRKKGR